MSHHGPQRQARAGSVGDLTPHASTARGPGTSTRTQKLPATGKREEAEIEMTGIPLLDRGLACDGKEGKTPECPLDERDARRLEEMLRTAATAYSLAVVMALSNVMTWLKTRHKGNWGPIQEVLFFAISNAIIGPLATMGAAAAARTAVKFAYESDSDAVWRAAKVIDGIKARDISGALTLFSKGVRNAIAHPPANIPVGHEEFIKYLQDQVPGLTESLMQGVAEQQLDQHAMLDLLDRLDNQEICGRAQIEKRVMSLLEQFDLNRIGHVGDVMDLAGGYEAAAPVRVRLKHKEYLVLCESFGLHNSALALNGANLGQNADKEPLAMESLVYIRVIEDAFHAMVEAEYKAKRKQDVPAVDFDQRANREKYRWFADFYRDVKSRHLDSFVDQMYNFGGPAAELIPESP